MSKTVRDIFQILLLFGHISFAYIQVLNPDELKEIFSEDGDAGMVESALANFGHIDYGSSIVSNQH